MKMIKIKSMVKKVIESRIDVEMTDSGEFASTIEYPVTFTMATDGQDIFVVRDDGRNITVRPMSMDEWETMNDSNFWENIEKMMDEDEVEFVEIPDCVH